MTNRSVGSGRSTETRKTVAFVVAAIFLVAIAWLTSPRRATPDVWRDRGQRFFPEFADSASAVSLEVIGFDEQTLRPRPFSVVNHGGIWTIPSHEGYPADARDRVSRIAASIAAMKKDDVAGVAPTDHERCGVVDPLDASLSVRGRGTRVTVKGVNERTIADVIVGGALESRPGFRYVRVPGEMRTYIARLDIGAVSTRFEDWIDRNVLQLDRDNIDQIVLRNYTVNAQTGAVTQRELLVLRRRSRDSWTVDEGGRSQPVDPFRVNLLITRLTELAIVDVRQKPPRVATMLAGTMGEKRLLQAEAADLARKGFYLDAAGEWLSNQGEVVVHVLDGTFYVLRFGGVAYEPSDGRYLFVTVGFDASASRTPDDDARRKVDALRARFAPWYYIVSNESVAKIRVGRADLVK